MITWRLKMTVQTKDIVTYKDGVKFTQCAYRGPKEVTRVTKKAEVYRRNVK